MGRQATVVLYVLAMVAVVVGVDILFFRHQFWLRLIVNVGIVLGICGVLFEVPEASMSAAAAMRLTQLHRHLRAVAGVRWPDER
jgi:predicted cobalt transporter CbtA